MRVWGLGRGNSKGWGGLSVLSCPISSSAGHQIDVEDSDGSRLRLGTWNALHDDADVALARADKVSVWFSDLAFTSRPEFAANQREAASEEIYPHLDDDLRSDRALVPRRQRQDLLA